MEFIQSQRRPFNYNESTAKALRSIPRSYGLPSRGKKALAAREIRNKELEGQDGLRRFHWLEPKSLEIQLQKSYEEVQSLRLQPDREIRYRDQVIDCANEVRVRANDGWRTESSTTEEHSNPYVRAVRIGPSLV